MVSEAVLERVERGAGWLDAMHPGWDGGIDLAILDIGNCQRCVFGQLFGHYEDGPVDGVLAEALGFTLTPTGTGKRRVTNEDWLPLTAAWRSLILARRAAAKAALQGMANAIAEREAGVVV